MKKLLNIGVILMASVQIIAAQGQYYRISPANGQGPVYRPTLMNAPENVLVVYNLNYLADENENFIWDGYEIAQYYGQKRSIPQSNIVAVKVPPVAEINRATFDSYYDESGTILGLKQQLEEILNSTLTGDGETFRTSIKYIILTKGIPHKIKSKESTAYNEADYSSVDAGVALLFNGNYDISWTLLNPYFNQDPNFRGTSPFIPEFYTNPDDLKLSYLVTRLDGYSVNEVKLMIDHAVQANETTNKHIFILDDAQKPYDRMAETHQNLYLMRANVFPDPWEDTPEHILTHPDTIVAIATHGTHAGLPYDYILNQFDFNLAPGAIFTSYESYNGSSFSPNLRPGQGQVADFISIGGSGGIGSVYEPYSSGIPYESILFPAYYAGYTFAEAAYLSLNFMDWTNVIVGDPLMRIAPEFLPQGDENFRVIRVSPADRAGNQAVTTVAEIVFSQPVDTTRLPEFYLDPVGDSLRVHVHNNFMYIWSPVPLPEATMVTYQALGFIYSTNGDSLDITDLAEFSTPPFGELPVRPIVYRAQPWGIDVNQNADLVMYFSQAMIPQTIYPVLGNHQVSQTHNWIDSRVLRISHPPLLPGNYYSFFLDEHATSVDDQGLDRNFYFNFETEFNFISFDIDNDGLPEYALNLNDNMVDGYEVYADSGGQQTSVLYQTDLNGDNQIEFLIQRNGENIPFAFWDPAGIPYTGYIADCIAIDDDQDAVLEYAFDPTGNGYATKVYDPNGAERIRDIQFILVSSNPYHGETNVELNQRIELFFSLPVSYSSILTNLNIEPSIPIEAIQLAQNGKQAILQFSELFTPETEYTLSVSRSLKSILGTELGQAYTISFTSGLGSQLQPPRVISFFPGDSAQIADNSPCVRFIFSQAMQTQIVPAILVDTTRGIVWHQHWTNNRTLYLFPDQQLADTTLYSFTVSQSLLSLDGLGLDGRRTYYFISGEIESDKTEPYLLQILPPSGNTIVDSRRIDLIFSEWVPQTADTWLEASALQNPHPFNWSTSGGHFFRIWGNPGWRPQADLSLVINKDQASDNNNNSLIQDYTFNYFVLGETISRDIDNDGISEYVIDGDNNLANGLELYQDPGGIQSYVVFSGDIDSDTFTDFIIQTDSTDVLLTWYPAQGDSGQIGFTEQTDSMRYEVSVDNDNLVEYTVDIGENTILPARPRLRRTNPVNGSVAVPSFSPIILDFSMLMESFSIVQSVQVTPALNGVWSEDAPQGRYIFTPQSGWTTSTVYTVRIDSAYTARNAENGYQVYSFVFRVADSIGQNGDLSWSFPANGDTVHSQANYYIGFSEPVDTLSAPNFTLIQGLENTLIRGNWINQYTLQLIPEIIPFDGPAILRGSGEVRFLQAPALQIDVTLPFEINDTGNFRFVRTLLETTQPASLTQQISFIFNQPPDSLVQSDIVLVDQQAPQTPLSYSVSVFKNYVVVKPGSLEYNTSYRLTISDETVGISSNTLDTAAVIEFSTIARLGFGNVDLLWQQLDDYLILNWAVESHGQAYFEVYLTDSFEQMPDTSGYSNRISISQSNSWLFHLDDLPHRAYLYAAMTVGNERNWSKPVLLMKVHGYEGELVSLPVLRHLSLDTLNLIQSGIRAVSQWINEMNSWQSAKYLPSMQQWSADIVIEPSLGILATKDHTGDMVWLQHVPDSIGFEEAVSADSQYFNALNPYPGTSAAAIAGLFGDATRLAVWDNTLKGWNEAVYEPFQAVWVNNFAVKHLEPIYIYSAGGYDLVAKDTDIASPSGFPSQTQVRFFEESIRKMEIYRNGRQFRSVAGCGIDTIVNASYINAANLDSNAEWDIRIIDGNGEVVHRQYFGKSGSRTSGVPEQFVVADPYPNPFNAVVTIPFIVPGTGQVTVSIFNILGQQVHAQVISPESGRLYNYRWKAAGASGIYLLHVQYKNKVITKRVLLIK